MPSARPFGAGFCSRRFFALAGALAVALTVAACGDSEADQRTAFIKFLNDINHRTGVHFLTPTDADRTAFGDYLGQYTLILDFNQDMKVIGTDFQSELRKVGIGPDVRPQTLEQMIARRQSFPVVKDASRKTIQRFEARLAKAKADRAALKQPADLKTVYDTTFDRLVATPVQAMIASDEALLVVLDRSEKIADYVDEHRARLTVRGSQIRAADAKTLAELNALIKAHADAERAFQEAQRDGDRVVNGR